MSSDLQARLQSTLGDAYRVERELGGGGMSRVFLLHEVELDRKVVVKVLPPDLLAGLSVERFRREIQLAARLQHPHIVPLLSAGARDGLLYYTMPFIAGESLRSRLVREHELPIGDVIRILRDVVDALVSAHESAVVHRDIKPDNILLSGSHAVVTDFGVSKALSSAGGSSTLTSIGIALGTPAYMSPEQAAADPAVDHRSDIYSVGALAYELLTGRPPFVGMPPQQVLVAHMSMAVDPPTRMRPAIPPALEQIVLRCLAKLPADRWQTAAELLAQLDALVTPSGGLTPAQPLGAVRPPRRATSVMVAGAVLVAAMVAVGGWLALPTSRTLAIGSSSQVTNVPGLELDAAISPDGRLVAYAAGPLGQMRIHLKQASGGSSVALTADFPGNHRRPRWSSDGQQLSFESHGALYVVPALGGAPRLVWDGATSEIPSPTLAPDGQRLVYAEGNAVFVRALDAGEPLRIATVKSPHSFAWSPDGRRIAFVGDNPWFIHGPTNIGNIAPSTIWIANVDGSGARQVSDSAHLSTSPSWMPDGRRVLYVSNAEGTRDVFIQHLTAAAAPRGAPIRLTTGLHAHSLSVATDGRRVAYTVFTGRSNIWVAPFRPGTVTPFAAARPITNENQVVEVITASPDGEWLLYDSNRTGRRQQIFKIAAGGGEPIQLTHDSTDSFSAVWSPDGRRIMYHAWRDGNRELFVMNADGRDSRRLMVSPYNELSRDWGGALGRTILFLSDRSGDYQLYTVELGDDGRAGDPVQVTSDGGWAGKLSPDGSMVTYVNQTARTVRVAPSGGGPSRVIVDGAVLGGTPLYAGWSSDSRTVFVQVAHRTSKHAIWAVPLRGSPRVVLEMDDALRQPRRGEFSIRGSRIFFTIASDESDVWTSELVDR